MNTTRSLRSLALAQAFSLAVAFGAEAASEDYAFALASSEPNPGPGVDIAVSLTDLRSNTPVSGAVIFATRLDMAPDGMEAMTAPVEVMPEGKPGIYHFKADLVTGGNWRLRIAAKVQGEAETVQGEMTLGVQP